MPIASPGARPRRSGLSSAAARVSALLLAVPGNPRSLVISEGLVSIPYGWYVTYLPLYMLSLGVSEIQIGLLASLSGAAQLISTLFGGHLADRFGRKRTLVLGDIVVWAIPLALYAVARGPWYFVVGQLLTGLIYLVIPAFECLFVEDVPEEKHPAVFAALRLAYALASLFVPIAGLLVSGLGMIRGGRIIMLSTSVGILLTVVSRQVTLRETGRGKERMATTANISPREAARSFIGAVNGMLRNRETALFLAIRVLAGFATTVWATYSAIFLTDRLGIGLETGSISLLPLVTAVTTIVVILAAADRIHRGSLRGNLILGQVTWLAGALLFALSPRGTIIPALLSTLVTAVSTTFYQPASQSYWAKVVDERTRAQAFSAASAAAVLCSLPAGPLAGLLYTWSPRAPFFLGIALQLAVLVLILALRHGTHGSARSEAPGR
jgi:MFS family permease